MLIVLRFQDLAVVLHTELHPFDSLLCIQHAVDSLLHCC